MVKGECCGSTVVEMTYLMPVILLVWALVIYGLLYFHDKVILTGASYETVVVGSERMRERDAVTVDEIEEYFQKRIKGKLHFFREVFCNAEIKEKELRLECKANRKRMYVNIEQCAVITYPEEELRKREMIKQGLEDVIK